MGEAATTVEFFPEGAGQEHIREGWSEIHEDTWTIGHRSSIELPPRDTASDYSLSVDVRGIAGPDGAGQRVLVSVNAAQIADVICRGAQNLEFFVPAVLLHPDRPVQVTFDLPHACRPMDFGHNNDTRLLAIRVLRITFAPFVLPSLKAPANTADVALSQRDVMLQIHSLGINCEVGFLQRKVGAEPLALFRWTTAPLPKLVKAMEQGFKGLGAPGSLKIHVNAETEFIVRETVFDFEYHSFVYANRGGTLEAVTHTEYNRLTYLSRALLRELRLAKKLFTYHDGGHSGLEDIRKLVRAMNQYGNNTLIWIVPTPPDVEVSTARILEPGLIQAFVSAFQLPVERVMPTGDHQDSWMQAILHGHRLWQSLPESVPVTAVE